MLSIDGSMGEGGGQVLRTSLALSLLTGTAFDITRIRAGRPRPGLMRQHLVAVQAAARIGNALVSGAEIGSTELVFRPREIHGGTYEFPIGSAGSTTLVFQTVLFPLLLATTEPSTVRFEGGTHNPLAPPLDFLRSAYIPLLARMGARIDIAFERYGFYPAGGGAWSATIHPASRLERFELLERGEIRAQRGNAIVAQIPATVALRELDTLTAALGWDRAGARPTVVPNPHGPGNALIATIEGEHVTEVFSGIGERGVRAERVAQGVADEVTRYLRAGVPVGEHLADQLLLPMALGSGGSFRTLAPSMHFLTQSDLLKVFLDVHVHTTQESDDVWRVDVEPKRAN
ncbi:RNA 3'-terminal phosphate cyclase [Labilithrix luteola]|uniref:RNA 3'-terminal phosphate cyclase n=1 Tax=Labilithrix luteola TaxID=1391654 RepID=A0A0K1PN75_9BACT|nr:RNA 3'-terminal phosphate cyclase [Labilithrix luteola]AKU94564.1 RNA 3'-terminal phosphate cyclase [Labilithrix luteola]